MAVTLQTILENPVLRGIAFPLVFTGLDVFANFTIARFRGVASGDSKFEIWADPGNNGNVWEVTSPASLESLRKRMNDEDENDNIVDIDVLPRRNIEYFGSVAIDLFLGAVSIVFISFLTAIFNLVESQSKAVIAMCFLVLLLPIWFAIEYCLQQCLTTSPQHERTKNSLALTAILFGLAAMVMAALIL